MYNPDQFIDNLSRDVKPVQRLYSPSLRLVLWFTICFIGVLVAMLSLQSFRPGFLSQLGRMRFLFETLLAFLPGLSLGFFALFLAVPGPSLKKSHWALVLFSAALFPLMLIYGHFAEPSLAPSMAGKRPFCVREILVWAWIPIGIIFYLVRRAYAFGSRFHAFLIGFSGASIPAAFMQVACMYDPYHALVHHFFPILIVAGVTTFFGPYLLRRKGNE